MQRMLIDRETPRLTVKRTRAMATTHALHAARKEQARAPRRCLAPRERDAMFPGLTVLQLLCGFRSVEDLEYAFPDCLMSSDKTRRLLNAMFPVEPSSLIGIA